MRKSKLLLTVFFITFYQNAFALTVDEYLAQVKQDNSGYTSSKISADAANVLSKKSSLLTTPNLFIDARKGFEKQNQAVTIVRYSEANTENLSAGIEQNFSFGVRSQLYYNLNRNSFKGLTSTTTPADSYQVNPVLTLEIPLWQDRFGASLKASKDQIYQSSQATRFLSENDAKTFEVESEKAYWALVSFRKIVKISEESLKNATDLLDTAGKRYKMNLGEKADVLQAKADFESRKLQLQRAQNDAKIAARNFNQRRYVQSDVVDEKLEDIDFRNLEDFKINNNMPSDRNDVKAQGASSKALVSIAKIEEEENKPTLNLYGSYGFNTLELQRADALSKSLSQNGDEAYVGVKFQMPIAIGLQSDIREAARMNASAARMRYRQAVLDQENDWRNLLQNINDYRENLRLSRKVEELQKLKLENEKKLLNSGRSSTYQVILFEQDYNNSRINTIRNAYDLLALIAQKKLYEN